MINAASFQYTSPAQALTPIYVPLEKLIELRTDGELFKYISLSSRSSQNKLLEYSESIATIYHNPPAYPAPSAPIATDNHTPPIYQTHAELQSPVANTNKKSTIFDRVSSDIDARFSKSELKLKAQKATNEFVDVMVSGSDADIDSATHKFLNSMQEISVRLDKFKTSSLAAEIELDIGKAISLIANDRISGTGSKVNAACIQNTQKVLTRLKNPETETTNSFAKKACEKMVYQTLEKFQEQFFTNLKNKAKVAMKNLTGASRPVSETSLKTASVDFNRAMKAISDQRVHLQGHKSFKNFASEIGDTVNRAAQEIFWNDVEKDNKADWIMIRTNLSNETDQTQDADFPNDLRCASARLRIQFRWMNEQEFLKQVETGIQKCIGKRFEKYIVANSLVDMDENTKIIIHKLKDQLKSNCSTNTEEEIAKEVMENRKRFSKLLMADDRQSYSVEKNLGLKSFQKSAEKYLKNNPTALDLAIGALVIDHLQEVVKEKLLYSV